MEKSNKVDLEERLITEISAYPCLFNKKDLDYSNRIKKKIWEEISLLLDYPVPQCKIKWKNLKDTFFHYVRQDKNTPSGSGAEKTIKWVHYDSLQFLVSYLDAPSTISNYIIEDHETGDGAEPTKRRKITNNVDEIILEAIQNMDDKKPEPEPVSESKLFLDSLVARFERLSPLNRSYIQFKIVELLHQIEFESSKFF